MAKFMDKTVRLSVIIPVYKVEQTLDKCVESVLSQNVPGMEIILVDDGSPDACPAKCDRWATEYTQIVAVHKPNGGLSDARNAGIDRANGQYLTFVDSDDFLEANTYSVLMSVLDSHPEYDILEYPICQYEGAADREELQTFDNRAYTDVHTYWYNTRAYRHTFACNKLYRRSLFANVRFPQGKVFEDALTFPSLLAEAHCIATTSYGLYHYRANPKGITMQATGDAWRMLLEAHLNIISNPLFLPLNEDYCRELLNIQIYTNELTGDAPRIPKFRFKTLINTKTILYNILGINTLCKINRIFRRVVRRRS